MATSRGTCKEAQVDYGYLGTWRDPSTGKARRVWAFSMVLSYSRHLFIYPTLRMDQASWVTKADIYDPKLNRAYAELGNYYQLILDPARASHPKDKPRIEALQKYIRSSFFAGRSFSSFAAMTADAWRWCAEVAGRRTPRILEGRTPLEVFGAEELEPSWPCQHCPSSLPAGRGPRWAPTPISRWAAV